MAPPPPPQHDLNAKWDACLDFSLRRVVYSSVAGAVSGLLLFRTPVTRWASIAFGTGIGIGSAYTECSHLFDGSTAKLTPNVSEVPVPKVGFIASETVDRSRLRDSKR